MKTSTENQNVALQLKRALARKRVPSMLDPFEEHLLQMDAAKKTLKEMTAWLRTQGIETSDSNLSGFLVSRREWRGAQRQLDGEKNVVEALQEWIEENPNATMEAMTERFKLLALNLSLRPEAAPEVLKLADRLAGTASRVANDRSRENYRTRKLVMEEEKHREWVKCEQTRAFELCLDEAKKYPEVADMYRAAFYALEKRQKENGE